jgi:hypothetical protein
MSEFTGDRRRRPLEHECPVGCVMRLDRCERLLNVTAGYVAGDARVGGGTVGMSNSASRVVAVSNQTQSTSIIKVVVVATRKALERR